MRVGYLMKLVSLLVLFAFLQSAQAADDVNKIKKANVGGYFHAGTDRVDESYNGGYSMYSAAWPLLSEYPGRSFQSGLFGTWMGPDHGKPAPDGMRLYTKIEGGLGWWRATEFPTTTPKFIMGGVELNFRSWANGPGSGKGTDWNNPKGHYGVAQLSPWVLFPPDGLNLKQGTCGELFGYGYLPLPLTEPKTKTAGEDVPTGNNCWTLFLSTGNFKGPVAFFTPYFWSRVTAEDKRLAGMFFDSRPCKANRPLSMETQHIHCGQATDSKGDTYIRMTQTQFPLGANGESVILHRLSAYKKAALWDGVKAWFEGGEPVDGTIDPKHTFVQKFTGSGGPGWKVWGSHIPKGTQVPFEMNFMKTKAPDPYTFGLEWDMESVTKRKTKDGSLVVIPEYYKQVKSVTKRRGRQVEAKKWIAVDAKDVPAETGLNNLSFKRPKNDRPSVARVTPDDPKSCWKTPGPAAGPFKVKVGDGSTVTYYWYRFADQPALLNADMTKQERERLQKRVEKLHRHWTKDRDYLAPPTVGTLADIDPALIVTPPKGMEVGFVPIVTRQVYEIPASEVKKLKGSFKFTEGPATDKDGNVFFTDIPNNRIHKWSVDGKLTTFMEDSGGANGLYFDRNGKLLACAGKLGKVLSVSPDGKVTVLADKYKGKAFNSPNDLWIDPKGGIYFTDPRYGSRKNLPQDGEHVYYISPDKKTIIRVVDDMVRPNGIIGTPDGGKLYVTDHGGGETWVYRINSDGTLSEKKLFADKGSDGMTLDEKGNLYLTTSDVKVYAPSGKLIRTIEVPERPANVTFCGKDNKTLFITARKSIYSVDIK